MLRLTNTKARGGRLRSAQAETNPDGSGTGQTPPVWITRNRRILTVNEGEAIDLSIAAFSNVPVTYTVVQGELPGATTLNSLTGRIVGTAPSMPQSVEYFFVVEASTPLGSMAQGFFSILVLAVNDAPVWVTPSNLGTIAEDVSVYNRAFDVVDDGGVEAVFLQEGEFPPNVGYNPRGRFIIGSPPVLNGDDLTHSFTMRAVDAGGLSSDRTFTITFTNVNEPPEIVTVQSGEFLFDGTAGNSVEMEFFATDDEPVSRLSWSINPLPPGLSFSTSGRLTGLIPIETVEDQVHTFTVSVIDRQGESASKEFTALYSRANEPPVWQTPSSLGTFAENTTLNLTLVATDDVMVTSVKRTKESPQLPGRIQLVNGVLSGSLPSVVGVPVENFTFVAEAIDDRNLMAVRTFVFGVENITRPPVWTTPAGLLGSFGQAVIVSEPLAFEDDEPGASYSLVSGSLPSFLTLTNGGVEGTVPLDLDVNAMHEITLRLTDSDGFTVDRMFSVLTGPTYNQSPVWITGSDLGAVEIDFPFSFSLQFVDDAPGAIVSFVTPLTFANLTAEGILTGVSPSVSGAQTFVFSAAVLDVTGLSAERNFSLVVAEEGSPELDRPGLEGETPENPILLGRAFEGTSSLSYTVWSLPARPRTLTLNGGVPPGFAVIDRTTIGGDLGRIVPEVEDEFRSYVFGVTAEFSGSEPISRSFAFIVDGIPNEPPTWVTEPNLPPINEGERFEITLEGSDDEPGLTYALVGTNNLPPLVALLPTGVLSGSLGGITQNGTFTFAAVITDALGVASPVRTFFLPTLNVTSGPVWLTPENTVLGTFGGLHRFKPSASPTISASNAVLYSGSITPNLSVSKFGVLEGYMPDIRSPSTLTFVATASDALGEVSEPRTFQIGLVPRTNVPPMFTTTGLISSRITNPELPLSFTSRIGATDDDFEEAPTGSFVSGSLPVGLTFFPETLTIQGSLVPWTSSPSNIYSFVLAAIDSDGAATQGTFSIQLRRFDEPPNFTGDGVLGTFFAGTLIEAPLEAVDDYGPLTFATRGSVPSAFSLTAAGIVRGIAPPIPLGQQTSTYEFVALVRDGAGGFNTRDVTIIIRRDNEIPVWQTSILPAVDERMPYGATLVATDDSGAVEFFLLSGALPETLALTTNGVLFGSAPPVVQTQNYTFTVRAVDRFENFADRSFVLRVNAVPEPPEWQTPGGSIGTFVGFSFSAFTFMAFDAGPVVYSRQSGAFPEGMSLNATTGVLSGTLVQVPSTATTIFRMRATDDGDLFSERDFSATVLRGNEPPVWQTPTGTIATYIDQVPFTFSLAAVDDGGVIASYGITPPATSLPGGFSINASGALRGTVPNITSDTNYSFSLRVFDAAGAFSDRSFSVRGLALPVFQTAAGLLGNFVEGNAVNFFILTDAQPPVTNYSILSGALPPGLTLNATTGRISGTIDGLASDTTYNFTMRIRTASNTTADRAFSMFVEAVLSDPNTNFLFRFDGDLLDATRRSTASFVTAGAFVPGEIGFDEALSGGVVSIPNNAAWNFSGDFTIETFVRPIGSNSAPFTFIEPATNQSVFYAQRVVGFNSGANWARGGWNLNTVSSATGGVFDYAPNEAAAYAPSVNHHIAYQVSGGVARMFVDGIPFGSTILTAANIDRTSGGYFNLNRIGTTASPVASVLDEFRFSRVARYSTADSFAPPSAPMRTLSDAAGARTILHIPMDTTSGLADITGNNFVDGTTTTVSSSIAPFPGVGSALFTATGGATTLIIPSAEPFRARINERGVNIEFWLNLTAAPTTNNRGALFCCASGTTGSGYYFFVLPNRRIGFSPQNTSALPAGTGDNQFILGGTTIALNTWTHVALQKMGWSVACYVNGALSGRSVMTAAMSGLFNSSAVTNMFVGTSNGTADRLAAYMSDLRVTVGPRYPFMPPSAPFSE